MKRANFRGRVVVFGQTYRGTRLVSAISSPPAFDSAESRLIKLSFVNNIFLQLVRGKCVLEMKIEKKSCKSCNS